MMKLLAEIFGRGHAPELPSPEIAMAMVRAQTESLFVPSMLSDEVRRIDPPAASLQDIEDAISECDLYWRTAYPETENELVEWIEDACLAEIDQRLSGTLRETMLKRIGRYR